MIGYNIEKVEELRATIVDKFSTVQDSMISGWPLLSSTMEAEWVGPDEISYETELAKNICSLYNQCFITLENMRGIVEGLALNWNRFQASNLLENADGVVSVEYMPDFTIAPKHIEIETIVKPGDVQFNASTNMGLTNGADSGTKIKTAFDEYITNVYDNTKSLYSEIDTSAAFLGSELAPKLTETLAKLGEEMAKLTTCHKSIYEALDNLIANYSTHESDEAVNISEVSTEIDFKGQNLK